MAVITIRRPLAEVQRRWAEDGPGGEASFEDAPGDQGTEVRADVTDADLRRFKQVLETGEVVRSDAVPEGVRDLSESLKQRPAQPMEDVA